MSFNLKYPQLGYLNNATEPFLRCENEEFPDIFIFYSTEKNSRLDEIRSDTNYINVKSIKKPYNCYVEIYKKINETD